MSRVTIANRSELFAAATAVSAVGLLGLSAPAHAGPMFPLAPPCSQWGFPGQFSLYQSNGYTVQFPATGPTVHGFVPATAANVDGEMGANGVDGIIQGSRIDFTILWHLGNPGPGSEGRYLGKVGKDGFAHGSTWDTYQPAGLDLPTHWDATVPLACITPA